MMVRFNDKFWTRKAAKKYAIWLRKTKRYKKVEVRSEKEPSFWGGNNVCRSWLMVEK